MQRIDARGLQQQIANLYLEYPELRDDDEMLRADMLEGSTDLHQMATVIVNSIADARALFEGTDARLDELKARKARFKVRIEFLRAMLLRIMQFAEVRKLELPVATVSQRTGQPQITGDVSIDNLPMDLCKVTVEPDRVKIREALLAYRELPGITLSNGPPTLAIHPK